MLHIHELLNALAVFTANLKPSSKSCFDFASERASAPSGEFSSVEIASRTLTERSIFVSLSSKLYLCNHISEFEFQNSSLDLPSKIFDQSYL